MHLLVDDTIGVLHDLGKTGLAQRCELFQQGVRAELHDLLNALSQRLRWNSAKMGAIATNFLAVRDHGDALTFFSGIHRG